LVIIKGDDLGRRIDLGTAAVEIGRSDQCAITIDSELVSRRHAVVHRVAGKFMVADLESTNGTYVNGDRVTVRALSDGDKISVGKTVLKYMESNLELHYHEQLFNMVSVDPLTGAFNKRYFTDQLNKDYSRCTQSKLPLSLVLLDIDYFKRINDTYGHPAGDEVLREITSAVKDLLEDEEALARVGGEEFAIILPGSSLLAARQRAELARNLIQTTTITFEGVRIAVTVSLGVAERAENEEPSELYRRADAQLYEAKRSGRNRVC
jgi:diguanylate cyclase (GGDEF)-like protein